MAHGGSDARGGAKELESPISLHSAVSHPIVEISPADVVVRRRVAGHGITAESIHHTSPAAIKQRFCAQHDLLVAYEQADRATGETFVEGAPSSKLKRLGGRLTFVPAGHSYREQFDARIDTRLTFLYLDPALLRAASDVEADGGSLGPRLLFDDPALWHLVMRLKALLDDRSAADRRYFEAIGIVLVRELVQSGRDVPLARPPLRGGLAGWQQRTVTAYIEANFAKRITLATLARLVRLSPCHFCRAFKQTFGLPPNRYQRERRIDHAKRLLAERKLPAMEIGRRTGFVSFGAFSTAFRKATGVSPGAYARSV